MFKARSIASHSKRRRGFTLIETALATVIVGVGIVAMMQLFAACTFETRASAQMSTATLLASNIQEAMGGLTFADPSVGHTHFGKETGETLATFNDIDDFDAGSFNPPIDSLRQQIPTMSKYTQVVSVWPVYPYNLSSNNSEVLPGSPIKAANYPTYTGAVRVRVRIMYAANPTDVASEIYQASWIRMDN
ncbi:MAG TPA: prepilin-type N-terminal cleavage/methylation domain-containing protein [Tepidisphaeraceae bacterium]|nr:prepilin-type N-terminal cleavage/methylation domain-containing protein [Tepidisphaeraceae bacterium]